MVRFFGFLTATFIVFQSPALTAAVPPRLTSLTLGPANVAGGASSTGTVTLNGNAPVGGITISLSSSNTAAATVPPSVSIPESSNTTTFVIVTKPVNTNPNVAPPGLSVVITASQPSPQISNTQPQQITRTATLNVLPALVKQLVVWTPTDGGDDSVGVVNLTGPAPAGGILVNVSSSDLTLATVPNSVTVPANESSQYFEISTSGVNAIKLVVISASRSPFNVKTAALQLLPPALSMLAINPSTTVGGAPVTGTVYLTGKVAVGGSVDVALASGNSAVVTVPGHVTVQGGHYSQSFGVTTHPVSQNTTVVLSASYAGRTETAPVFVVTPSVQSVQLNPSTVDSGGLSTGKVRLTGEAPFGGAIVHLSSSNPAIASVGVPTVTILPGVQPVKTFPITTHAVTDTAQVTISASYNGSKSAILTVVYARPDLYIQGVTYYDIRGRVIPEPVAGKIYKMDFIVANKGTAPAGPNKLRVQTHWPGDPESCCFSDKVVPALMPGASVTISAGATTTQPSGTTMYVNAIVDISGQVDESNESNNELLGWGSSGIHDLDDRPD